MVNTQPLLKWGKIGGKAARSCADQPHSAAAAAPQSSSRPQGKCRTEGKLQCVSRWWLRKAGGSVSVLKYSLVVVMRSARLICVRELDLLVRIEVLEQSAHDGWLDILRHRNGGEVERSEEAATASRIRAGELCREDRAAQR